MGFAKYHEDNIEITNERVRNSEWPYAWEKEYKNYSSLETLHRHIKESSVESGISYNDIYSSKLESIKYRLELIERIYVLRSPIMIETIRNYKRGLKKSKNMLENEMNSFKSVQIKKLKKSEKTQYKNTFIYQLIDDAFLFISKIQEDNPPEIQLLCEDMRVLVSWHGYLKEIDAIYTPCGYTEFIDYLKKMYFETFESTCPFCYNNHIAQTNYCIRCYRLRK